MTTRSRLGTFLLLLLAAASVAVPVQEAFALITGGEGNKPIHDPGWPKGGAVLFNKEARIAYWEGPPFGGGQWHAECRGDAKAFSDVLADFAELDVKSKRVVLHDGVGQSFWLNMNDEPAKRAAARMDWRFMVWVPANWERLQAARGSQSDRSQRCRRRSARADQRLHRRQHQMGRGGRSEGNQDR